MTFLEAAIEILNGSDEALHFKEIARQAVAKNLLSHVGRDPEAAMQSCLNQAVRSRVHDGLVTRAKPGHYLLRPGAAIPDLPSPPPAPEPVKEAPPLRPERRKKTSKVNRKANGSSTQSRNSSSPDEGAPAKRTRSRRRRTQADTAAAEAVESGAGLAGETPAIPEPTLDPSKVRFSGPEGSGLEGDTDVALVMANAASRLVADRPELRDELEALQKGESSEPEVIEVGRKRRREGSDRYSSSSSSNNNNEERGGRRRKRRRRKSRRADWSDATGITVSAGSHSHELLERAATALAEVGGRSLHVRQIAENLANHNVLGGEISEIERAVTAAMLLDIHQRGEGSRFAVRGDARYQLRGSRLPQKAAAAEQAARVAVHRAEQETSTQILLWLQSLGVRSLEALVRVYLEREGFALLATLPPSRGLGKLVVDDPEAEEGEGRTLVLVVPRRTSLEPKFWDGEAERNRCSGTMVFAMGESGENLGDARVTFGPELGLWLLRRGIGVRTVRFDVPLLDADFIESISGLDT